MIPPRELALCHELFIHKPGWEEVHLERGWLIVRMNLETREQLYIEDCFGTVRQGYSECERPYDMSVPPVDYLLELLEEVTDGNWSMRTQKNSHDPAVKWLVQVPGRLPHRRYNDVLGASPREALLAALVSLVRR